MALRQRRRNRASTVRAGHAVHERHAVGDDRRRDRADEKELERRFRRDGVALQESGQHVQRNRHQLERDEQQDELARRRQHHHAEQRDEQREVVLGRAAVEGARAACVSDAEHAERGGSQEQPLGEERQAVLDERAAEAATALRPRTSGRRREQPDQRRPARSHADRRPAAARTSPSTAGRGRPARRAPAPETSGMPRSSVISERSALRDRPTIRSSSGTVAVSTGPIARPGATPKSTSTNTRMPSAAHSVPCASGRCWKCGSSLFGPQKICLRDAQHVDRRQERADDAGEQPPASAPSSTRRGTSGTRRRSRPSPAGPSDDRPPIVKAVAMPGIIVPKPPILKISRECAFS